MGFMDRVAGVWRWILTRVPFWLCAAVVLAVTTSNACVMWGLLERGGTAIVGAVIAIVASVGYWMLVGPALLEVYRLCAEAKRKGVA